MEHLRNLPLIQPRIPLCDLRILIHQLIHTRHTIPPLIRGEVHFAALIVPRRAALLRLIPVRPAGVAYIHHWVPQRAQLPIQNSDDSRLSRVQDEIVKLIVAMDDGGAIGRYVLADVIHDLVEVWVGATELFSRLDVLDLGLLGFDAREGVAVACVEVCLLAEVGEADGVGVDRM